MVSRMSLISPPSLEQSVQMPAGWQKCSCPLHLSQTGQESCSSPLTSFQQWLGGLQKSCMALMMPANESCRSCLEVHAALGSSISVCADMTPNNRQNSKAMTVHDVCAYMGITHLDQVLWVQKHKQPGLGTPGMMRPCQRLHSECLGSLHHKKQLNQQSRARMESAWGGQQRRTRLTLWGVLRDVAHLIKLERIHARKDGKTGDSCSVRLSALIRYKYCA